MTVATKYVTEANGGCLLSAGTGQELGLITLHLNTMTTNNHPARLPAKDKDVQNIVNKYRKVFQGQGKLQSKQIELIIDQAVKPVAQRQGIEPVPETEEAAWISPLVIFPKKDDNIRLCVDIRTANNAIKRVRHPIPTVKDISLELKGAKFFSKLDLSQAYHQLELAKLSIHYDLHYRHGFISI